MKTTTLKIFTATLAICLNMCFLPAQTTVNWPLSSKTDTIYVNPSSGTGFTAGNQTNSNLNFITWTGYGFTSGSGAERVKGSFSNATNSLPSAFDPTVYVEYAVSAASGYDLTVSQIQMYLAGGGTSSVYAQILYSTNNFATSTTLDAGSAALVQNSATAISTKSFSSLSIPVPSGSTLRVRVMPKYTGSASTSKYLINNNVSITFTPSPSLTNSLQNVRIPGVTFDGKMIHNNANLNLQVYDVAGQRVINSNRDIDMSSHARGIYIVKSINGTLKISLN